MTARVAAEYTRLVAAGARPGPTTVAAATHAVDTRESSVGVRAADIATMVKAGLMTRGEGRLAAGLPDDTPRNLTEVLFAASAD
jgi:hypothetical protein